MIIFLWLFITIIIALTTAWIALAIHFHVRRPWLRYVLSSVPLVIMGAALLALPIFPEALAVWFGLVMLAIAWWFSLRPKANRDWAIGMDVLPQVEIRENGLHVRNFRNFSYTENGKPIPHYEKRVYDLRQLSSIDYFLSHWSGPMIAHTLVSFGFGDQQYLCVSVEARRQKWQKYSPVAGLFRAYELMFVLGDERDIVRLRTNVRHEKVYLYRVRLPSKNLRRLLLDYVSRIEKLTDQPEWYNSVTSNCTTNLFYQGHANAPCWLMPRILLNGLSAGAMYQLGYLGTQLSFEELQARSDIGERALEAGDAANFSQEIRSQRVKKE